MQLLDQTLSDPNASKYMSANVSQPPLSPFGASATAPTLPIALQQQLQQPAPAQPHSASFLAWLRAALPWPLLQGLAAERKWVRGATG